MSGFIPAPDPVRTAPLVSVIVPAYNAEEFLGDCLSSILDQDHPRIEVLVIDDGSTDRTPSVAEGFGPRVRYFRQTNSGSAVARNRGLDEARGELIAFCDSDDLWTPGRLAQQVAFLESQTGFHAVCGEFREVGPDFTKADADPCRPPNPPQLDASRSGWAYHWILRDSLYHLDTLLVRRSALAEVRFDPKFRRGQDFDFFLQLAQATPIAQLAAVYALYRQHGGSITRQPHLRNYRAEVVEQAVARWGLGCQDGQAMSRQELSSLLSKAWFSHGWDLYHARWFSEAARAFERSASYRPTWGAWRYRWLALLKRPLDRMPAAASRH